jgi:hypothetical protein
MVDRLAWRNHLGGDAVGDFDRKRFFEAHHQLNAVQTHDRPR